MNVQTTYQALYYLQYMSKQLRQVASEEDSAEQRDQLFDLILKTSEWEEIEALLDLLLVSYLFHDLCERLSMAPFY